MLKPPKHARLLPLPGVESLSGARLEALRHAHHGARHDFIVDYHELALASPPVLALRDGQPVEQVQGYYLPRRLRFIGVESLKCTGLYLRLETLPLDHPARSLRGALHFRPAGGRWPLTLFWNGSPDDTELSLTARRWVSEGRDGEPEPAAFVRDWSPPPPLPARLVPQPVRLHRLYAGDPVTIHLGARRYHHRLFVGGVDYQSQARPAVDAALNVGEDASRWLEGGQAGPLDRWACKGEGRGGMSAAECYENWSYLNVFIVVYLGGVFVRLLTGGRNSVGALNRHPCIVGFNFHTHI